MHWASHGFQHSWRLGDLSIFAAPPLVLREAFALAAFSQPLRRSTQPEARGIEILRLHALLLV
jgi:hypothetical protein